MCIAFYEVACISLASDMQAVRIELEPIMYLLLTVTAAAWVLSIGVPHPPHDRLCLSPGLTSAFSVRLGPSGNYQPFSHDQ